MSLAVRDLQASIRFYRKLGFSEAGGDPAQGWTIMRNGPNVVGLFAGMFDGNLLTFNPGWDQYCDALPEFADVREIQRSLKAAGLTLDSEADEAGDGPASIMLTDPDGNRILIDQHRQDT